MTNASATSPTGPLALLTNTGTGSGIDLDQSGAGVAIDLDQTADGTSLDILSASTSGAAGVAIHMDDAATTG